MTKYYSIQQIIKIIKQILFCEDNIFYWLEPKIISRNGFKNKYLINRNWKRKKGEIDFNSDNITWMVECNLMKK